ncbi:MAG: hypothetical protein Q4E47_00225 [Candidatus Saccharibacteria bacterium]|nr:hypothetical protein [Candidatus Saccharibacteria bacterium]
MGVIVNKEQEKNSDLNNRITADLRKKVQESSMEDPDFARDIDYGKDTVKTSKFGWVWIVLIVLALISLVIIFTI